MTTDRLVRVPISGATLFLTSEEFTAGIRRGKAILRAERRRKRAQTRGGDGVAGARAEPEGERGHGAS